MTTTDFLRARTPREQAGELDRKIAAAEAELLQHQARLPDAIIAKLEGDPDAAARVEKTKAAIADLEQNIADLRSAAGALRARAAAAEAAEHRNAVERRAKNVAELRREYLANAVRIQQHMEAAAVMLRGSERLAEQLAGELEGARRFLSLGARMRRLQSGIARLFVIDEARGLTAANSLLGIASGEAGERSHWPVIQHERTGCDDLVAFYDDQTEAEAARARLAARKDKRVLVPLPGGCWVLVPIAACYGDIEEAAKAAKAAAQGGRPMSIIGHAGGWVLVDARFAADHAG